MANIRLLTYSAAAQRLGITEKAFRDRVQRGSVPDAVLFDRPRGNGKRPERFVVDPAFSEWMKAPNPSDKEQA